MPSLKAAGVSDEQHKFLCEMEASRERAAFGAWWEAYKLALETFLSKGILPMEACEKASLAAVAAEVDYRDRAKVMVKRIAAIYGEPGK